MKIALGQINPTIGDFLGNRKKIIAQAESARSRGARLILFPEMSICGYPPMDLLDHGTFVEENLKSLRILQKDCPPDIALVVGYVDKNRSMTGNPLQNIASVILDGRIIHRQAKTLLPTYDVFDESRYFQPAAERKVFTYGGTRFGIAVCEDVWWESEPVPGVRYPVDPVADLLDRGAEILLVPSASPFYAGKKDLRCSLVSSIGTSSGVPVYYTNMVGGNDNLIFDGYSFATSAEGKLLHLSPGFREDMSIVDDTAASLQEDKNADIIEALCLGIRDYLKKCGFNTVHLGLSGGIDSALVAALAARALGPDKVRAFGLPSPYSSQGSVQDAMDLAKNLRIEFSVMTIADLFAQCTKDLNPYFKDMPEDITEENLQARLRGLLLMAYSNKFGSLLLTTGNKSELAVGYATLYGDMCGSLAVIGDLFKTEVYELARYLNKDGEIIPETIISKAPSAELRPGQKDQDSLPPYDLLDQILARYILESKTAREIIKEGFNEGLVREIITKVGYAEYKRRQAPPVLKVSPKAFGTGRRMPIARHIYEA